MTRLNISNSCQIVSRFIMNSSSKAFAAVKTTLRYLQDSKKLDIIFREEVSKKSLEEYIDADFAKNKDIKRFTDVYVFKLFEDAIS